MADYVFVYGTLKKESLHSVVPHIVSLLYFREDGFVQGRLFHFGEYPGAKPSAVEGYRVYGQLVQIRVGHEEQVLQALDDYEEYSPDNTIISLFIRKKTKVFTATGCTNAWIYWYNAPVQATHEIIGGVYMPDIKKQQ